MNINQIIQGDTLEVLKKMPSDLVDTIITSPPYWGLRDYGVKGQIGLEPTLDEFIGKLLKITKELQRVLKPTGVMYWNHGDCYGGTTGTMSNFGDSSIFKSGKLDQCMGFQRKKEPRISKCLVFQNYRLITKMIDQQGWILRNTIIWHKPNHMPSSVKDRFANSYEPVFMLVKNNSPQYWYNLVGKMADKQPDYKKGTEDEDWKWGIRKGKKVKLSLWQAVRYWFDLDAVRKPHKYPEDVERRIRQDKEDGIMPFAKNNKDGIAWRRDVKNPNKFNIRDRVKKGGKPVAFMASPQETNKIPKDLLYGKNRLGGFVRARELDYNTKTKKQKFITPEQQKETQEKTGWIEGSGRVRSFFDNFGGQTNPKGKNPGDVWKIATQPFPEAHFATFPEKLITPMILSSCPKEICKKCGKARVRISKKDYTPTRPGKNVGTAKSGTNEDPNKSLHQRDVSKYRQKIEYQTIGWTDCKCKAGFRAGIVLDPFIGSGTVAVVAKRHMRNWLGIELNPEYIKIAKKRITGQPVPMF